MQQAKLRRNIGFTETLIQCMLFLSIAYTIYIAILNMDDSKMLYGLWVIPAVFISVLIRKNIDKFALFYIFNGIMVILSVLIAENDLVRTMNFFVAILICAMSVSIKNKYVVTSNDDTMPVGDNMDINNLKNEALKSIGAKSQVSPLFILLFVIGYIADIMQGRLYAATIQIILCIFFVILQIASANLRRLYTMYQVNKDKNNFPAKQIRQVYLYNTVITSVLIMISMIIFYNGPFGNIIDITKNGLKNIGCILGKVFLFLFGVFGTIGSGNMPEVTTEESEELSTAAETVLYPDNPIQEAIIEAIGIMLILAVIAAIIYALIVYMKNFNRTRHIDGDLVNDIRSDVIKQRAEKKEKKKKINYSESEKSARKLFRKGILEANGGKVPDLSRTPSELASDVLSDKKDLNDVIVSVYEKARYSDKEVSEDEISAMKKALDSK